MNAERNEMREKKYRAKKGPSTYLSPLPDDIRNSTGWNSIPVIGPL